MRCPNCRLENPDSTERCDCGFVFATGVIDHDVEEKNNPPLPESYRIAALAAGAISTLFGLFVMLVFAVIAAYAYTRYARRYSVLARKAAISYGIGAAVMFGVQILLSLLPGRGP